MRKLHGTLAAAAVAALAAATGSAQASPVVVLDDGRATVRHDPYVPAADLPTPPRLTAPLRGRVALRAQAGPTVYDELGRLLSEGAIDQGQHDARRASYRRALKTARKLTGARRLALEAAIDNVESMAARGAFTPSRLGPIFLTLERNREWWTEGPLLSNGRRVAFADSAIVYQYYSGEGIQIQPLASFGKANALWADDRDEELRDLLGELVPLAAERAGGLAWEYLFDFGGGAPPWTSGLSQGTAVQALARGADRLGDPALMEAARRGLTVFETPPPEGIRVDEPAGPHYLIYSFARNLRVLNGFLQAVIGLHDFAEISGDPRVRALYESGDAEARVEVPRYDTGAWSLYSLERESDLSYHRLVTDFLRNLCNRTAAPVYCETRERFRAYLGIDPKVRLLTKRVRAGRPGALRVSLSKISRVAVSARGRSGGRFSASAVLGRGKRSVPWPRPTTAGLYDVALTVTDLAGNRVQATGVIRVLPARKRSK